MPSANKIIELEHIGMDYGERPVLHDVNITVNEGDFVAITGPNGGGKTTLLRIILQLIKPTDGKVRYYLNGVETQSLKFGYLPQKNMIDGRFPVTVEEVITSGLKMKPLHRLNDAEKKTIDDTIELVGLGEMRDHAIGELSGGQLQRTLLGRAIIGKPHVLVLDEPLSYIDKQFEEHLYGIIGEIAKSTTVILVSHEMTTISQMANRHIIVDRHLHECSAHHHFIMTECR
jgi:zinc transport system ATP-binding protein